MASELRQASCGVFPYTKTPAQLGELRLCANLWHEGPERFWPFDEVVATLARVECLAYYVAATPFSPWFGVMMVETSLDSADLLYVYVKPQQRGQGLARLMLVTLMQLLRQRQCRTLLLEVRPSNSAALALYKQLGFAEGGRRPGYYRDGEDALVLHRDLTEAP